MERIVDHYRADLGEILPQHVEGAAPDDAVTGVCDPELLDVLEEHDRGLSEQDATVDVALRERTYRRYVRGSRTTDLDAHCVRV